MFSWALRLGPARTINATPLARTCPFWFRTNLYVVQICPSLIRPWEGSSYSLTPICEVKDLCWSYSFTEKSYPNLTLSAGLGLIQTMFCLPNVLRWLGPVDLVFSVEFLLSSFVQL